MSEIGPGDLRRIEAQLRLRETVRAVLSGRLAPWFAHLRIRTPGQERDVLFGTQSLALDGATLVDWKSAELVEVLLGCDEGDEFEVGRGDSHLTGAVLERNFVRFAGGELVEIATPKTVWRRGLDGWSAAPREVPASIDAPLVGRSEPRDSLVDVHLDAAQRAVVELPRDRHVLVLGEAGHGKTTVALHRLAHLRRSADTKFRAAVLVPTEGLRRLVESTLVRLGAPDAEAWTFERWAARQARWAFPGIPRRESEQVSAAVLRLKRHPALLAVLREVASTPERRKRRVKRDDLLLLFGDRALLEPLVDGSHGAIRPSDVAAVLEHTRLQFSEVGEKQWSDVVDPERLRTLDGRSLDDGTPAEDAGTIDPEDYAVLFELDRMRTKRHGGRPRPPRPYECIVLDEAQELAPLELALIGRSVAPGGSIVVAGDADQQVDPTASFAGWAATMKTLSIHDHAQTLLAMSYRCPPGVTATARAILGTAHVAADAASADGSVEFAAFDTDGHVAIWLADELRRLREEDRAASIAIIARTPETARHLARVLRRGFGIRLVLDGDFGPGRGIRLTSVREVKGLEFDHVVVPDASAAVYPDTAESRRALYVASTRAIQQLIVATGDGWTPILAPIVERSSRTSADRAPSRP